MSMTIEQVAAQLQKEVFTLKAQFSDQTGLAEAVRAIKRQSKLKKATPSLIDVNRLGRPKDFFWAKRRISNCGRRRRHFSLE